jgi:hypothetical protein
MSGKKGKTSSATAVAAELSKKARGGDIDALTELDSLGFLLAPGETLDDYADRVAETARRAAEFQSEIGKKGKVELSGLATLEKERRIGDDVMAEAAEATKRHYGFAIDWVPGFFLSKGLGLLWGGCAVSFPDDPLPVFLVRAAFADKRKWLFYRRDELLAHELCHVARAPLNDMKYEETFAYRLSPSSFRAYLGGCFERQSDAFLFLAPFFLLLAAQTGKLYLGMEWVPIPLFWALLPIYPAISLLRNHLARRTLFKAAAALSNAGTAEPFRVLFRSTASETAEVAALADDPEGLEKWLDGKVAAEPRWKVAMAVSRG